MKTPHDFAVRFQEATDADLIALFNQEVGKPGWVSARGEYLTALHQEMQRRNWDLRAITDAGLSIASRIVLVDGKIMKV